MGDVDEEIRKAQESRGTRLGELQDDDENGLDEWTENAVSRDVLVKRETDESWTIVNWQLSRHSGRWLTDALTITE